MADTPSSTNHDFPSRRALESPKEREVNTTHSDGVRIDIAARIDGRPIGLFQFAIYILCGLCLFMDGFDVQAWGYVAPSVFAEWQIPSAAGRVASAGLFGLLLGLIFFSMLADKIGRRPVLIGTTIYFGVLTLATALVTSLEQLLLVRFLAGLGLGATMPNAMALVSEYTPKRSRVLAMLIVSNGFTIGAVGAGFIAAWLIPNFGWRAVFYVGGVIPIIIGLAMWLWLPESLQFLALRNKNQDKIGRWLRRIDPSVPVDTRCHYAVDEAPKKGVPIVRLFADGRSGGTILLWVIMFTNLLNLYFLSTWLPTIAREAGLATAQAVLVGTMFQIGGAVGAFLLGWPIQRFGFFSVLTVGFLAACVSIGAIGQPLSSAMLFTVVFIAGFGILGGQAALNALAATYYPTDLRATGVGAASGVGRLGSVIGPVLAEFMRVRWTTEQLFLAAAIPAMISAVAMMSLKPVMSRGRRSATDAPSQDVARPTET
jgi:MFS transporter, AAHS family, 4-hydroxybenzoate transporter